MEEPEEEDTKQETALPTLPGHEPEKVIGEAPAEENIIVEPKIKGEQAELPA